MKFNVLQTREDIIHAIREGKKKKNKCLLWQTNFGTKTVFEFFELDIDNKRDLIRVKIYENHRVRSNLPVFIRLNHRNTIFKGYIHFIEADYIYFKIPSEVKLEEAREFERFKVENPTQKEIFLNVHSELINNAKIKIPIVLDDLSQSGLGAFIREKDKFSLFNDASEITISGIGDVKFKEEVRLDVVHTREICNEDKGHKKGLFKIGIKFKEILAKDYLQLLFKDDDRQYLHQYDYLKFGNKFKKKLRLEMENIQNEILLKEDFFETFAMFVIHNKGGDYIPSHVKKLSMASCALAKLLAMNERVLIEQLVYTSFIHDIAFYKVPRLAKIKCREEFNKVKDHFTLAETQLYFKAHSFAHEYCLSDKSAPYGAEYILDDLNKLNKHPNREKYLKERNISYPLAIFMVAHELIEFSEERKHWTFSEFIQSSKLRVLGGAYDDIFASLNDIKKAA